MAKPEPCLRLARPEDVESIHRLFCLPEVYQYLADGQAPPVQIAHDWVEASPLDHDRFAGGLWLLHDPSTLQLMGLSRLHAEDTRALELTFLLDPIFWGQGWATRMAHTIIMYAFHSGFVSLVWAADYNATGCTTAVAL
ncbi:MAG: GNAT family N-acetyltransferase [Pseudomonadota bacterium]